MIINIARDIRGWWRRFRCRSVLSRISTGTKPTDVDRVQVLLLAVALWMPSSETCVVMEPCDGLGRGRCVVFYVEYLHKKMFH
jgi:hypothetical protein